MSGERWIKQTRFYPRGTCMQCAMASLLGRPLDDVPDFWARGEDGWWDEVRDFCAREGLVIERFVGGYDYEGYYLASGPDCRGFQHVVVMKDGEMVHDPHPQGGGIVKQERVYVVRPADLAQFRRLP